MAAADVAGGRRDSHVIATDKTMTKSEQGTVPEYDHHQLAGESNQETRGLNSHGSAERCDLLPRASSRANEVTMEQFERGELDAIEGPSLGRLQTQTMLQRHLNRRWATVGDRTQALFVPATPVLLIQWMRTHSVVKTRTRERSPWSRPGLGDGTTPSHGIGHPKKRRQLIVLTNLLWGNTARDLRR